MSSIIGPTCLSSGRLVLARGRMSIASVIVADSGSGDTEGYYPFSVCPHTEDGGIVFYTYIKGRAL